MLPSSSPHDVSGPVISAAGMSVRAGTGGRGTYWPPAAARNQLEPGPVLSQVQLAGQERLCERRPHVAVHRWPGEPVHDQGHRAQEECLNEGRSAIEVQALVGHAGETQLPIRGEWRARQDLNPRPDGPKPPALSTELRAHIHAQRERITRSAFCHSARRARRSARVARTRGRSPMPGADRIGGTRRSVDIRLSPGSRHEEAAGADPAASLGWLP